MVQQSHVIANIEQGDTFCSDNHLAGNGKRGDASGTTYDQAIAEGTLFPSVGHYILGYCVPMGHINLGQYFLGKLVWGTLYTGDRISYDIGVIGNYVPL